MVTNLAGFLTENLLENDITDEYLDCYYTGTQSLNYNILMVG